MPEQSAEPQSSSVLSDLLGALLIDLARAQHLSNLYSKHLGEIYKIDPLLRVFPVPNGYLTEVTVDLQLAIDGLLASNGMPESGQVHVYRVLAWFVHEVVAESAGLAAKHLRAHSDAFASKEKALRMSDALLTPQWQRSLSQEALNRILPRAWEIADPDGSLHGERGLEIVSEAVVQAFEHPDYAPLPEDARSELRQEIAGAIREPKRIAELEHRLTEREATPQPSVRVTASADALNALGSGAFGKIVIRASVRDFLVQAVPMPDNSGANAPIIQEFRLVPAKN